LTSLTFREMFMCPINPSRAKEARVSLLAGDMCSKTPYWLSLKAFRGHLQQGLAEPPAAHVL
jgi:hypothetical protein